MLNENEGLPIKLEWFNHLLIYNKEELSIEFKEPNFPECTNYPNLKVKPRELPVFEKHQFTSYFLQEVVTYDQTLFTDNFLFHTFFENENIEENIGKTKKIDPYLLLIDTFKEMTNHMEGHCCLEDFMEVREFFTKKIITLNGMQMSFYR